MYSIAEKSSPRFLFCGGSSASISSASSVATRLARDVLRAVSRRLTLLRYVKQAEPRKSIPATAQVINRVLEKAFTQRAVNGAPEIHYGVVVVKNVNAFLFAEIYWL